MLTGAAAILSVAFLLRVLGQAIQRWMPQPWLPPFSDWQGSAISYPALLTAQVVILAMLAFMLTRMAQDRRVVGRRTSRAVIGAGGVYFGVMVARLLLGIFWLPESEWFTAWISAALHLALASIVMIWGWHQLGLNRCGSRRSDRRSCA